MTNTEKLSIKNWAEADRPREKLQNNGITNLSDAELLAILLVSGNRNESAVELSKKILASVQNNLNELARLSLPELMKFKGIGQAKAITIAACLELGKRRKLAEILQKRQIKYSSDIFDIFQALNGDLPYEEFWVLFLTQANTIIDKQKISQGGVNKTVTDIRLIIKLAIEKLASAIVLCHNHPSGNIAPSKEDLEITNQIIQAAGFFSISVIDHLIIGNNRYYSFADEGLL